MTRRWNGRESTRALTHVIARDGDTCHLCQHPGANSVDHETPVTIRPDLAEDPTNWRPAHLYGAGHPKGCHVDGCHCPGNNGRNNAPAETVRRIVAELNATDEPTREW